MCVGDIDGCKEQQVISRLMLINLSAVSGMLQMFQLLLVLLANKTVYWSLFTVIIHCDYIQEYKIHSDKKHIGLLYSVLDLRSVYDNTDSWL